MKTFFLLACTLFFIHQIHAETSTPVVSVYFGYVTQFHCKGRLYLSAVGNEKLITLQAIPKELGCGVIISPLMESGKTDLLLKTSTGDIHIVLEIQRPSSAVSPVFLEVHLSGGGQ